MKPRRLTLTTIGVPVRAELRLKSLLSIVGAKTVDRWTFSEDSSADLAICEPGSALTAIAVKRSQRAGLPRCVSLIRDEEQAIEDTLTLRDPIRAADFVTLLNAISAALGDSAQAPPRSAATEGSFHFATTLRGLLRSASRDVYRIQAGSFELHVLPASRSVLLMPPAEESGLLKPMELAAAVNVMQFPESHAVQLFSAGAQQRSADLLLWRLGMRASADCLLPELLPDAQFKLRRWPDFGRLEHSPEHLRLAARLSRQEIDAVDLAASVGQPIERVRPFINACALCDLLNVLPARIVRLAAAVQPPKNARAARSGGLFHSIRSALGFGTP